jgi:hypothetical protein
VGHPAKSGIEATQGIYDKKKAKKMGKKKGS